MNAQQFNKSYPVGNYFIYRPRIAKHDAYYVRTVREARDLRSVTIVEINIAPHFANVESLTPAG
ncbi:hypothetical protein C2W27_14505 [Salmonella enterica]|nr:hypothetical protein [Salmonella enterica]